jgi:deazaflavin-dependent oxidoreductase (nitroreductase family)
MFTGKWMKALNRRMVSNYQRGIGPRRLVLLLTTTGRKSGLPRVTPLQYEEMDGVIYVASARGAEADWFKNLQAGARVQVQIGERRFAADAEAITDAGRIADFLEMRLKRRPLMIGLIMWSEGLPWRHSRAQLEAFAAGKALAALRTVSSPAPGQERP